ncbi:hypothetical protein ANANG_G00050840 [Anguilla anguilla]|uniref:Uncharacterized protein n=1 Tax=Anguilla anguilla TaxID=7936 RepID=A0A9D3MUQ6_ANGAN|nr:hypothetical protein ANANG_G00050840 [Anguilla anguilla]
MKKGSSSSDFTRMCEFSDPDATAQRGSTVGTICCFSHDNLTLLGKMPVVFQRETVMIPDQWTLKKKNARAGNKGLRTPPGLILHLVDILLCVPASAADCERGFNITYGG